MQQGGLIGPVIVAIGVVLAAIAFAVVTTLIGTADSGADLRMTRLEEDLAREVEAREGLAVDLVVLKSDFARLRDEASLLANRAPVAASAAAVPPDAGGQQIVAGTDLLTEDFETPSETEALTEQMLIARDRFNKGVTQPRNRVMMELLGPPRDSYSTDCQPITSPRLKALVETREVGPIRVTMLRPALDSLERVFARLAETDPDIHAKIGTAGAVCARFIRGSSTAVSNHSWGTAIDVTLQGELDPFADGGTQFGLLLLAEYFNDEGWYWGAGYNREDSMHFEVGEELLRRWAVEGML